MKDTNLLIENGVDVNRGIELLGDIETYNDMLEDFLSEVDEKMSNLNLYKEQGDMPNYAILAHSLKSDSKYFGFTKLIDLAYSHELESKNNNLVFVKDNFLELKSEVNRIVDLINKYLGK
jgi:HPt (histidine-containing phosphotransfer) domain-containing protein